MRFFGILGSIVVIAGVCSCLSDTQMRQTWTNPVAKTQPAHFDKVLAVVIAPDQSTRRAGEDELVKRLAKRYPTATVVPSYAVRGLDDLRDPEAKRRLLTRRGFDGAFAIRLTRETVGGDYLPGLGVGVKYVGSYPTYTSGVYETTVIAETTVHDLDRDVLLWSGTTESSDPKNVKDLVAEVSSKVQKTLDKHGVRL